MTTEPRAGIPAGERAGWLVADIDGHILLASPGFQLLVGASDARALTGNWIADLAVSDAIGPLLEASRAASRGEPWRGPITLRSGGQAVELLADVSPGEEEQAAPVVLWKLTVRSPLSVTDSSSFPGSPLASGLELEALQAQVATLEAMSALPDPLAAARALLQELRHVVPYDWGVVLRFTSDRAEVIANYPAGIAGADVGVTWEPLDAAERAALFADTPSLIQDLPVTSGRSPLSRLPAFGLHSALRVPLLRAGRMVGAISLYAYQPRAFTAADGIALERYARPLTALLERPSTDAPRPRPVYAAASAGSPESTTPPAPHSTTGNTGAREGAGAAEQHSTVLRALPAPRGAVRRTVTHLTEFTRSAFGGLRRP